MHPWGVCLDLWGVLILPGSAGVIFVARGFFTICPHCIYRLLERMVALMNPKNGLFGLFLLPLAQYYRFSSLGSRLGDFSSILLPERDQALSIRGVLATRFSIALTRRLLL